MFGERDGFQNSAREAEEWIHWLGDATQYNGVSEEKTLLETGWKWATDEFGIILPFFSADGNRQRCLTVMIFKDVCLPPNWGSSLPKRKDIYRAVLLCCLDCVFFGVVVLSCLCLWYHMWALTYGQINHSGFLVSHGKRKRTYVLFLFFLIRVWNVPYKKKNLPCLARVQLITHNSINHRHVLRENSSVTLQYPDLSLSETKSRSKWKSCLF